MKPMHPELLHAGDKNVERCLLLPLVVVHGGIDKMHSFRIYSLCESFDTPVREVGIDRQVMILGESLAQINESRINGGFASAHMQQPTLFSSVESFRPMGIRAIRG